MIVFVLNLWDDVYSHFSNMVNNDPRFARFRTYQVKQCCNVFDTLMMQEQLEASAAK